jgi:hypothetical protein
MTRAGSTEFSRKILRKRITGTVFAFSHNTYHQLIFSFSSPFFASILILKSGLISRRTSGPRSASAQTTQCLQKFGIKPDGIINFLPNEPPFRYNSTLKISRSFALRRLINSPGIVEPGDPGFLFKEVIRCEEFSENRISGEGRHPYRQGCKRSPRFGGGVAARRGRIGPVRAPLRPGFPAATSPRRQKRAGREFQRSRPAAILGI